MKTEVTSPRLPLTLIPKPMSHFHSTPAARWLGGALLALAAMIPVRSPGVASPEEVFRNPPPDARPGVMWMWMGSNNSKEAITRDLEALHGAGYGRTLMFNLADVTTPWAHPIGKSPTPEIVAWTRPWWALVRHAALESKRLGMEFGMFNGPGYETSGGPWITPELTMQEVCFSKAKVAGGSRVNVKLDRPAVDPRAVQLFPVYDPATGTNGKPEIPARSLFTSSTSSPKSGRISAISSAPAFTPCMWIATRRGCPRGRRG